MHYVPEAYESLPSLQLAGELFEKKNAAQHLIGPIRQLFLDKGLCHKYGISLLHKHFSMEPMERLVEYHHSASPWVVKNQDALVIPRYEGAIVPRTFRFFEGKAAPYEFSFSDMAPAVEEDHEEFVLEVSNVLRQYDLDDVFGVRLLDDYDSELPMEVTEGNVNIMMPVGSVPDSSLMEALWVFSPDETQRCHCLSVCRIIDGKHRPDHGCS
ncbi:hypothetical protein F4811DRAFT_311714 [Daldinia bambusicola]|nr:hypothetical protein F4811DRAFT_311714 [Daldinia bambusicola]